MLIDKMLIDAIMGFLWTKLWRFYCYMMDVFAYMIDFQVIGPWWVNLNVSGSYTGMWLLVDFCFGQNAWTSLMSYLYSTFDSNKLCTERKRTDALIQWLLMHIDGKIDLGFQQILGGWCGMLWCWVCVCFNGSKKPTGVNTEWFENICLVMFPILNQLWLLDFPPKCFQITYILENLETFFVFLLAQLSSGQTIPAPLSLSLSCGGMGLLLMQKWLPLMSTVYYLSV